MGRKESAIMEAREKQPTRWKVVVPFGELNLGHTVEAATAAEAALKWILENRGDVRIIDEDAR
jgi:hypothetical protein